MNLSLWVGCIALMGFVTAATGCARTPRVTFYTLDRTVGTEPVVARTGHAVAIGSVTLPELVNRKQLVVRGEGNRVEILELHRWASPLRSEISRVLAENLRKLLGTDRISAYPESAGSDAEYRVLVDIQRFEAMPGDAVTVEANWTIRPTAGGVPKTGRSVVREEIGGAGYNAVVGAYGRALAGLSRDLARALGDAVKN